MKLVTSADPWGTREQLIQQSEHLATATQSPTASWDHSRREPTMKILVTGSRALHEHHHQDAIWDQLDYINEPRLILIHGAARGADLIASNWCHNQPDVYEISVPAKWHEHGTQAGPIRNRAMLALSPDLVLAFPKAGEKNVGTRHMMAIAQAAGIPVKDFWI